MKDDHSSEGTVPIETFAELPRRAGELTQITVTFTFAQRLEQVEVFAFYGVILNRSVSGPELHIPDLSFSGVKKHAVGIPSIPISVLLPAFSGEQEDEGLAFRCRDPALSLTTVGIVDIVAAVVDVPHFEQCRFLLAPGL